MCCVAITYFGNSQNLAGVDFDATMGVMDPNVSCMVDAGTMFGLDIWTNNSAGCPGDGNCGFFQNIEPMYNTFSFKNIVNLDVCLEFNFITRGCGFNTGFWIVEGDFIPSPPGSGTDPCTNNTVLTSSTFGGTTTSSFVVEGCQSFSVNAHNGTQPSQACTYSFNFSPDPVLDLRCGDEPMCIEKVIIGGTPVPTMTEWGLFLFGLILLTLGVVTMYNMSVAKITDRA
jgi:hypothetical protein